MAPIFRVQGKYDANMPHMETEIVRVVPPQAGLLIHFLYVRELLVS